MKSLKTTAKILFLFNLLSLSIHISMAYFAYFLSFGLGIFLLIILGAVSTFYLTFQIGEKSFVRMFMSFITKMIYVYYSFYLLYHFIGLKQGKTTDLINPSEAHQYADHTFFHLKNHSYDQNQIAYYQEVYHDEGNSTYTNYYACPIKNADDTKEKTLLWIGYSRTGRISNKTVLTDKLSNDYEYFAKYDIEQSSFQKAIRKAIGKEKAEGTMVVYGVDSPEKARAKAWSNYLYSLIGFNIAFLVFWLITTFYDFYKKGKKKKTESEKS